MKRALIFYGGWAGHQPEAFAELAEGFLWESGFEVERHGSLDCLDDAAALTTFDLIVPIWTMGDLRDDQERALLQAVEKGTGIAGWHGGMGDAFRENTNYQFMVGGQFVAHPGNIRDYQVEIVVPRDPITEGLQSFEVRSEQYYLHVDPSNEVLATTTFSGDPLPWLEGTVMPVVWKRRWGRGRVFYSALGHGPEEFEVPEVAAITRRGLRWASR